MLGEQHDSLDYRLFAVSLLAVMYSDVIESYHLSYACRVCLANKLATYQRGDSKPTVKTSLKLCKIDTALSLCRTT